MFQESLFESTATLQPTNRWATATSVAAQAAVLAAIIVFPLLHPETLLPRVARISIAAPPAPRPPVHVEPTPRIHVTPALAANSPAAPSAAATSAPRINPHPFSATGTSEAAPVGLNLNLGSGPAVGALPIGSGDAPAGPRIVVGNAGPASGTHVSSGVAAGLLLSPIHPDYPAIARMAHVSGTVTVEAVISREGRVESAHATSGPDMLRAAAIEAVCAARYRPYLLNGQPTEVEASYTIHFNLGS